MRKKSFLCIFLLAVAVGAWAGDVATFVNLGFSSDSHTFVFGQYGVESETGHPYAELFAVDVPENVFHPSGVIRSSFDRDVEPGQDGRGAFFSVLLENRDLVRRYNVDPLSQGRPVYVLLNGQEPQSEISFRDFETGTRYEIVLRQQRYDGDGGVSASFHIQLSVYPEDASVRAFTVGLPGFRREGVSQYRISQALLSPDQSSMVFVVERISPSDRGRNVRYMVETVQIF